MQKSLRDSIRSNKYITEPKKSEGDEEVDTKEYDYFEKHSEINIRVSAFYLERFRFVNYMLAIFCLMNIVTGVGYVR